MTIRPKTFRERVSRCLIALLAVSLCPLLPVNGFAQDQSNQINKLITELKSPNPAVRRSAAETLGKIGAEAKDAVPALIAALKDADHRVRNYAVVALRGLRSL
jgi:HEAT repeat protein